MHSANIVILATFATLLFCVANARTDMEKFNGAFKILNSTIFVPTTHQQYDPSEIHGFIMYIPACPLCTYGNMSVLYGGKVHAANASAPTCQEIDAAVTAYGGGYTLDTTKQVVTHLPIITKNPSATTGSVCEGCPAPRNYYWMNNDNLLLLAVPGVASLYWQRVIPFPAGPQCTAAVSVTERPNSAYASNGVTVAPYDMTIQNTGDLAITALTVTFTNLANVQNSWNIQYISDTTYRVTVWGSLASGSSYNAQHGFIAQENTIGVFVASISC